MKYGLFKYKESKNLGDEIQSLAAKSHLPSVDEYLDRDHLNTYKSIDPVKVIMNGWYMERPENWPPSDDIIPLFVSMHMTHKNGADNKMLSSNGIKYLKKHEPIGCRDHKTTRLLEKKGIKAYYSGCLTTTLPERHVPKTENIVLVDAFYRLPKNLRKKYINQLIPEKKRKHIRLVEQDDHQTTDLEKRFDKANALLDLYAGAKVVFTSRIHCALPCLALGTPVYFIDAGFLGENQRDRFEGITNHMNVIDESSFPYPKSRLKRMFVKYLNLTCFYNKNKSFEIDWDNLPKNPTSIKPLQESLKKRVKQFING